MIVEERFDSRSERNICRGLLAPRPGSSDLLQDEEGLSTVEYIIILVLIAIIAIVAWQTFGEAVEDKVRSSTTDINGLGSGS